MCKKKDEAIKEALASLNLDDLGVSEEVVEQLKSADSQKKLIMEFEKALVPREKEKELPSR